MLVEDPTIVFTLQVKKPALGKQFDILARASGLITTKTNN